MVVDVRWRGALATRVASRVMVSHASGARVGPIPRGHARGRGVASSPQAVLVAFLDS